MGQNAERTRLLEQRAHINKAPIYCGKFIEMYQELISYPDGSSQVWDLLAHPGAVAIIAINKNNKILLVEQWRRAVKQVLLEIPAGLLEKGEDPYVAAQRELQEEIGFKGNSLNSLGGFYVAPGISNEFVHLFLAKKLEKAPLIAEDTAHIDVIALSQQKAIDAIMSGKICDAKTIIGILRWVNS